MEKESNVLENGKSKDSINKNINSKGSNEPPNAFGEEDLDDFASLDEDIAKLEADLGNLADFSFDLDDEELAMALNARYCILHLCYILYHIIISKVLHYILY